MSEPATLTIEFGAACAALGVAFHAFAAPAPAVTSSQYEFRCLGATTAKVELYASDTIKETNGWNPYLAKAAAEGWEPIQFIMGGQMLTGIQAVCMRRVAPPPAPVVPEGPRCLPADQAEMRKSGMSETAIKAACDAR